MDHTNPIPPLKDLGPFGQLCLDFYTVVTLGFRITYSLDTVGNIKDELDTGCGRLTQTLPFLAGLVIREGRTSSNSGIYSVTPSDDKHAGQSLITWKDATGELPMYSVIVDAKAPASLLKKVCDIPGDGSSIHIPPPWPVFIIQATWVKGGLVLTFAAEHNVLDMSGLGKVIEYFAYACGHTQQELDAYASPNSSTVISNEMNIDRHQSSALDLSPCLRQSQLQPPSKTNPNVSKISSHRWTYWRFPKSSLTDLKNSTKSYSSNDAICALYAQSVSQARCNLGTLALNEDIQVIRPINTRRLLGLPDSSLIHAAIGIVTTITWTDSLPAISTALRTRLKQITPSWIQSYISLIRSIPDKSRIFDGGLRRPSRDIVLSSWSHLPLYNLTFGNLGKAGFVRRPDLKPIPDLGYTMPTTREGDVDLVVCLEQREVEALRKIEAWVQWVEYIG